MKFGLKIFILNINQKYHLFVILDLTTFLCSSPTVIQDKLKWLVGEMIEKKRHEV